MKVKTIITNKMHYGRGISYANPPIWLEPGESASTEGCVWSTANLEDRINLETELRNGTLLLEIRSEIPCSNVVDGCEEGHVSDEGVKALREEIAAWSASDAIKTENLKAATDEVAKLLAEVAELKEAAKAKEEAPKKEAPKAKEEAPKKEAPKAKASKAKEEAPKAKASKAKTAPRTRNTKNAK